MYLCLRWFCDYFEAVYDDIFIKSAKAFYNENTLFIIIIITKEITEL